MRAAPGRAVAPRLIARKSRRVGIAVALETSNVVAHKVADQGEHRVKPAYGAVSLVAEERAGAQVPAAAIFFL